MLGGKESRLASCFAHKERVLYQEGASCLGNGCRQGLHACRVRRKYRMELNRLLCRFGEGGFATAVSWVSGAMHSEAKTPPHESIPSL